MALNSLGVVDLSFVTDSLLVLLKEAIDHSPLWSQPGAPVPGFIDPPTGNAPDAIVSRSNCQLSLFLFHVAPDPYQRNATVVGSRVHTIPTQPLSLDLYYLLSAYAKDNYQQEQQAMSIAMQCFHQNPIVSVTVPLRLDPPNATITNEPEEFTLTMETETVDSLSRLWQSTTAPIRLSAVYKASVIFITPPAPATDLAKAVKKIGLAADPVALPFATNGHLIGAYRKVTYTSPFSTAGNPKIVSYDSSTATVAAGQTLILYGSGLQSPTATQLYLIWPDGSEHLVTNWIVPNSTEASRLTLEPSNVPKPGVYQLRVGSDTSTGDPAYRSNAVPISIAASIATPPDPPILTPPNTTLTGTGFLAGQTEVLIGLVSLVLGSGLGSFQISNSDTRIDFQPPADLPTGLYPVRVRVNRVESDPAWWVQI
jgi:hypothetical protein